MNEQTADTEVVAQPTSEETNVEESLDQVLSEYDQAIRPETTGPTTEQPVNDNDIVVQYVKSKMVEDASREVQTAVDDAIKTMKESAEINIPDKALQGYLNLLADEDPRFRQAFLERHTNPQRWNSAVKAAGKQLVTPSVDPNTTEDMVAVTESLTRGTKTESPAEDAPLSKADFDRMSDAEFRAWESKNVRRA